MVSLELFNTEGEANLSAVDIANELDISPGNLYYHFKGKEELVVELFARYEAKLGALLRDHIDVSNPLDSLEDNWLHFYVILEQIYSYRFFYRNLSDILQKYPALKTRFHRLIDLQYNFVYTLLTRLVEEGFFADRSVKIVGIEDLANSVMLTMIYWFSYQDLRDQRMSQHDFIQRAILQMMAQVAPYIADSQSQFMEQCYYLYQAKTGTI